MEKNFQFLKPESKPPENTWIKQEEMIQKPKITIKDFPYLTKSPQYYFDQYNNEELFRQWFDAQFPQKTIYDIVGVTEQVRTIVSLWIKQYAKLWSNDEIE